MLYFAGWIRHYSLDPASARHVAAFKDHLAPCEAGKGGIRFPFWRPAPLELISRIAKFRSREAAAREEPKKPARKRA